METRCVMKKQFIRVLSLVLAMAMLLSLSACGGNTGTTGPQPTEPQSTEPQPTEPKPTEPTPTEPTPTEPKPTEPKPTEPQQTEPEPTEPEPSEPVDPISTLGVVRGFAEIQAQDGIQPFVEPWDLGKNVKADLSGNLALAYSLSFSSDTKFEILPAGFDSDALLEWGKYPGLNIDILHKYGFTGKGAVIAYVDQPVGNHPAYDNVNLHYTNNTDANDSMHGPTVLSMLAGTEIGTAPDAEVYFYGHASWYGDAATRAECLYQIIERNKLLPDGEKITMVGFSDNLNLGRPNEQAFIDAVAACEEAGIMVWFCGEYSVAAFLPYSDRNNPANVVPDGVYGGGSAQLVYVPGAGRTAATSGEYIYWASGGLSWTMPYILGLYAIAAEIDPTLTQDEIRTLVVETAYHTNQIEVVNPVGFIAAVLERVGRGEEGQAMLDEVAARQKYIYAIMDTAAMTEEDLASVGKYLTSITHATVLVADAAQFANAEQLYAALKEDDAQRGGQTVGVQIFGTPAMVPSFEVRYKALMCDDIVDEMGTYLTDLFYSNFNNDPVRIANGYSIADHFSEGWDVDLVPAWPVARLPLSKGEFSTFFEKYNTFAETTGLQRQELVVSYNSIFAMNDPIDNLGAFVNRMSQEFGLLDIPYRLYGNQLGDYPVPTEVMGDITAENLTKENEAGIVEFLVSSHGQRDNVDKVYFVNGEENRESLVNMDTINSVMGDNVYYWNCYSCNNGLGMEDNLVTVALNGNCVGMFAATTIISNNGVFYDAGVEDMAKSNFYYFFYYYFKALHEGESRSRAFFIAQREYATALIAHSVEPIITQPGNYQFNLNNLLAYQNFGLIEPNVAAMALVDSTGYIAQAGQSVPKQPTGNQGGGQQKPPEPITTDGKPVGTSVNIKYSGGDGLKTGTLEIHSFTTQALDNGYIRFSMEFTATKGMDIFIFNPPNGEKILINVGTSTGECQTIIFDIPAEDVQSARELTMSFNFSDDDRTFIFFNTVGIS